jgi:hypothetical protein
VAFKTGDASLIEGIISMCKPDGMKVARTCVLLSVLTGCSEQPKREVSAVVISIAPHPNPKWGAGELVVTARSFYGAMGSKSVPAAQLSCRVGDTVQGSAQGITLTFDDQSCRH